MSDYMVKYMQKLYYEGLQEKDNLKSNMALEWFNNCNVRVEDNDNILCEECPLSDCLLCKDVISEEELWEDNYEYEDEEEW